MTTKRPKSRPAKRVTTTKSGSQYIVRYGKRIYAVTDKKKQAEEVCKNMRAQLKQQHR